MYKALYVPPETPVINKDYRDDLLACLCAFHDFSEIEKPKKAGAKRDAFYWCQAAGPYWIENRKAPPMGGA